MKKTLVIKRLVLGLVIVSGSYASVIVARNIWAARADASLHRDHPKEIAIWFAPDKTEVCLHPSEHSGNARVHFEILDNGNKMIVQAEQSARLGSNTHITTTLPIALGKMDDETRSTFKWNRLRYSITVDNETRTEIVQLADAMPNEFALRVTAPEYIEPGMTYHVAAHAENPDSAEPIKDVSVSARLKDYKTKNTLGESSLATNDSGQAFFDFKTKKDSPGRATLVLTAFKGGDFETQLVDVGIAPDSGITISTDKPLYQPGQTVHCRTLLMGRDSHQAIDNVDIKIILRNDRSETIATAPERTDKFGVAAHDFELSEEAGLGKYFIQVVPPDNSYSGSPFSFEVSKYELPTFSVKADPDKKFYLDGETAQIKLNANYLFGKPVAAGKAIITEGDTPIVRTYRTTSRTRVNNGPKQFEGAISDGQAEISIGPLKAPYDGDNWRFYDREYSAYITDSSTGRTEQTKFTLRISREALHAYVRDVSTNVRLPLQFFVTTDYPDGSPAECDVDVDINNGKYTKTIHTSRYGLAKVITDYIVPLEKKETSISVPIKIKAHDSQGKTGTSSSASWMQKGYEIQLDTDRGIYRAGDPVNVTVTTPRSSSLVRIEVIKDFQVIGGQTLKSVNGKATAKLLSDSQFEGLITLAVYPLARKAPGVKTVNSNDDDEVEPVYAYWGWTQASKTVLFPPRDRLNMNVQISKATVKPGEDSEVQFRVTDGAGQPVETSLGVAVIDKSVSVLAETNSQFGARKYYYNYFLCRWNYPQEISGMTIADLLALDFTKPIPDDLSPVAELILNGNRWHFYRASSRDFEPNYGELYQQLFSDMRGRVASAVVGHLTQHGQFPVETAPLSNDLPNANELKGMVDPWGTPYRFKIANSQTDLPRWDGKTLTESWWSPYMKHVDLRSVIAVSAGPDKVFDSPDDVSQIVLEYPAKPVASISSAAIEGRIQGYNVNNGQAHVVATRAGSNSKVEAAVDNDGKFKLTNIPAGMYKLEISVNDAIRMTLVDAVVLPRSSRYLDTTLPEKNAPPFVRTVNPYYGYAGSIDFVNGRLSLQTGLFGSATFSINGSGAAAARSAQSLEAVDALIVTKSASQPVLASGVAYAFDSNGDMSLTEGETPRLRQYFPETLVWQPQLITDANGIAKLKFPTADSITTWQLAAVGSTVDGKIGTGSAEIRAFQDFFAEPQLPPTLTEGDQFSLPVVVRNYMDQAQAIKVTLNSADWYNLTTQNAGALTVDPGSSARTEFGLKVVKVGNFTARVDAIGRGASDAVERPVRVGYDGREIVSTQGDIVNTVGKYEIDVPSDAIPGSAKAVLKLYPNLLSSALDGIEGMTQRPWGCLEQTISSTYGNLLVLRYLKDHPQPENSHTNWAKIERHARKNLEDGVQRVYTFPTSGGGFSYFGGNNPDLALTAYALQFLTDAKEFVAVRDDQIKNAQTWLESIQNADGSWKMRGHYWERQPRYATTAYVAYALSYSGYKGAASQKAFTYLENSSKAMQDAYAIALYALAAEAVKDQSRVAALTSKLAEMAIKDGNGAHWGPPERTLFYGWGRGGTVETTALAIQALSGGEPSPELSQLANHGLLFLAKYRDRTGSWYSTQATVQAITSLIKAGHQGEQPSGPIQITVNGKPVQTVDAAANQSDNPIIPIDVTQYLTSGANHVEVQTSGSASLAMQLVTTHFVRWDDSSAASGENDKLDISVSTDKQQAKIGEDIKYKVTFKRSDWQMSGMSIIEVGLPPGAEVDRSSLESLLKNYSVSKYSVTPDHVIFYVWPSQAAAQILSFVVRPRLAIDAKTASTVVYDYYNPDAWRVAAPLHLIVQ